MAYHITNACVGCAACVKLCPVGAIAGERKALHVIDEGACIECGACGRICPHRAVTDPFGILCRRMGKPSQWPKPVIEEKACTSCRICIEGCPTGCLGPADPPPDKHERAALKNPRACISCGFCAEDCPVGAIVLRAPAEAEASSAVAASGSSV